MKIKLFDTHVHYNLEPLVESYKDYINQDLQNNIFVNIIGTDIQSSIKACEIANEFENSVCSIGLHPDNHIDINNVDEIIQNLEKIYLKYKNKIVAIGECGLDYFHPENPSKENQYILFIKQIEMAIKYNLPLILHIRNAHEDALAILKKYNGKLTSVIIHCYTDNEYFAQEYVKLGFYVSFSGIITFKKLDELRRVVEKIDINHILSETDAPWLSPEPIRGKVNCSQNIIHINKKISEIKLIDEKECNKILLNNAFKALKLDINKD